jgi:CopA family copper-resistance protein
VYNRLGYTYTYLMNGRHPAGNWTGLFAPGERVRLRIINASAMTYFNLRIPDLPMTVVQADGQDVQPVETDELQIAIAETYDVIVTPQDRAYTVFAESMDRSGFAAGTLAPHAGMTAAVPALRRRPLRTMTDMGMDHSGHGAAMPGMDHAAMGHAAAADPHAGHAMGAAPVDHAAMGHAPSASGPRSAKTGIERAAPGPVLAVHGADTHGAGNAAVAQVQRDRTAEPGTGLADVAHRVLVYADLLARTPTGDTRAPARDIELHLTGHMQRYMWSFDGKKFSEVHGPIRFEHGERLRLTLVNDTMMEHPIHLHGMFFELDNGAGAYRPRKHTVSVKPAERLRLLVTADEPGRWAFHCHLLYHMHMGMMRVVEVA